MNQQPELTLTVMSEPVDIGDIMTLDVTINPRWWQFWKEPRVERRQFIIEDLVSSRAETATYSLLQIPEKV
jgi:hypothetical protein